AAGAADEQVVARAADQDVIAEPAQDQVVGRTAGHRVVPGAAADEGRDADAAQVDAVVAVPAPDANLSDTGQGDGLPPEDRLVVAGVEGDHEVAAVLRHHDVIVAGGAADANNAVLRRDGAVLNGPDDVEGDRRRGAGQRGGRAVAGVGHRERERHRPGAI